MLRLRTLLCLLPLLTSACGAGSGTDCLGFRPIFTSSRDVLTEGTARQLLDHNETGAKLCGWKPPQ